MRNTQSIALACIKYAIAVKKRTDFTLSYIFWDKLRFDVTKKPML